MRTRYGIMKTLDLWFFVNYLASIYRRSLSSLRTTCLEAIIKVRQHSMGSLQQDSSGVSCWWRDSDSCLPGVVVPAHRFGAPSNRVVRVLSDTDTWTSRREQCSTNAPSIQACFSYSRTRQVILNFDSDVPTQANIWPCIIVVLTDLR